MFQRRCHLTLSFLFIAIVVSATAGAAVTEAQEQEITQLLAERERVEAEIVLATEDHERYAGGLIKSLIATRLEVLRTTSALLQQRVHAIQSGAEIDIVVSGSDPDPDLAARLLPEIEAQRAKVEAARQEAARYSGGLVQAMGLSTAATLANTLALLEQRYLAAEYGLPTPGIRPAQLPGGTPTSTTAANPTADCLQVADFDSSVLDWNDTFVQLAWKVDVSNSCSQPFTISVRFAIYDANDFELDDDTERVMVPASGSTTARGTMLVSPTSKASRMTKQGASISVR